MVTVSSCFVDQDTDQGLDHENDTDQDVDMDQELGTTGQHVAMEYF